jgi:hypothetical protein
MPTKRPASGFREFATRPVLANAGVASRYAGRRRAQPGASIAIDRMAALGGSLLALSACTVATVDTGWRLSFVNMISRHMSMLSTIRAYLAEHIPLPEWSRYFTGTAISVLMTLAVFAIGLTQPLVVAPSVARSECRFDDLLP